jgi:intracellular sulfur oxidation DsrE/DsrF family protein
MKRRGMKVVVSSVLALLLVLAGLSAAWADKAAKYEGLMGVKSTKVFFDVRDGDAKFSATHIELILMTYKDLKAMGKKPEFVVVFMARSIKLVSKKAPGFSMDDKPYLDKIAKTLSQMAKAGIRLEACLAAAQYFNIDPADLHKDLKTVPNGWISEIGYQAKGYSLVPVY